MLLLGLVEVPLWLILVPSTAILLYLLGTRNHGFFKNQGIPGPNPLPYFGNMLDLLSIDFMKYDANLKKKYGKLIGLFSRSQPTLVTFDEEMISQVTVKQFSNFQNRVIFKTGDKVFESMLTQLEDEPWKHARSTMSPTFTTGKLRQINRCAKQLAKNLSASSGPFETRDLASAYTLDVIASTAFGLRVDSQSSDENPFVTNAKKITDISARNPAVILGVLFPWLGRIFYQLGYGFLDKVSTNYFLDVVRQTMQTRTEGDTSRTDFLQIMRNASRGKSTYNKEDEHEVERLTASSPRTGLSEDEVLGGALIFFFGGYDTTSVALTQLLYCLATNPDCQHTLHEEIDAIFGDEENVNYDDVMKMSYLDQCLHESQRLYPAVPRLERVAGSDCEVGGIKLTKGSVVAVPVYALHHDPEIYKDPETFNPDRFSAEEKAKRSPLMFLPFGYGPRSCIGQRLAIYELKVAVVHMLKHNTLVTCSKTENPIQWAKGKWLKSENGIWLAAEKRN